MLLSQLALTTAIALGTSHPPSTHTHDPVTDPSPSPSPRTPPEISQLDEAYVGNSHVPLVSLTVYVSTIVFTLGVLGLLSPHGRRRPPAPAVERRQSAAVGSSGADADGASTRASEAAAVPPRKVSKGGTVSLAVFWLSSVVISVSDVRVVVVGKVRSKVLMGCRPSFWG